ncbi:MAG: hypothetical protein MJK08_00205 [Campylobacterales bacterium]|nr:hypothetical protein [Campylobacterales bacterium]
MIYPNKFIDFDSSILNKMLIILEIENVEIISISELYKLLENKFDSIDEFIYALDVLYLLDKIEINFEKKEIYYATRN